MKTLFTCLCAALLLGLSGLFNVANAQPSTLTNTNGTFLCPNYQYGFTSTTAPSTSSCSVNWSVTGGTLLRPNPTSPGFMFVAFDDVPGGVAKLQATYTSCGTTAANGQSPTLTVYIRSITNVPLRRANAER